MKTLRQFSRSELRESIENGCECVSFSYCFSLVHTIHGESRVFVVNGWRDKLRAGFLYTIGTALFGWWGLHGIYLTPIYLFTNLCGGNDLTDGVLCTLQSEGLSRTLVTPDFGGNPTGEIAAPADTLDFLSKLEKDHRK